MNERLNVELENFSPEAKENIRSNVFRVFLSSTFLDMQEERNRLLQHIFPAIRKRCKERGVEFVLVDLRWGVTAEDKKKTVGICLREIQRSNPFFIGFLGERYGWKPKEEDIDPTDFNNFSTLEKGIEEGLSITEIEFQFGALDEKVQTNAAFWLRSDKTPTPEEFRETDKDSIEKLIWLKERLRAQEKYPVADYDSSEDLGSQVENVLKGWLDKYFPEREKRSWLDKQNADQEAFERYRKRLYIKNGADYDRLNEFVASQEQTLVVVGDSGLGKSALFANWKDVCAKGASNVEIFTHYVSASENSDLPANVLRRLTELLEPSVATENEPALDLTSKQKTLEDYSKEFAAAVAKRLMDDPEKRLIFVVDGLNQLSETEGAKELSWLPETPERAKYLLSTIMSDPTLEAIKRRKWNEYEVVKLDEARRREIIVKSLKTPGKKLTPKQAETISNFSLAENPLVLKTLLDELCVFGDHNKLDDEIERYVGAKSFDGFFDKVFERLESNNQFIETDSEKRKEIVEKLALLLALARFGLTENELVSEFDRRTVSTFLCALDAQLVNRSGRYSFAHDFIRQAVLNRYEEKIVETRRLLIDKFSKPDAEEERRLQEVPFQFLRLESWEELRLFLLDFDVLEKLYDETFNCDFCMFWNAAKREGRTEFQFTSYMELDSSRPMHWYKLGHIADVYTDYLTAEKAYPKALALFYELPEEYYDTNVLEVTKTINSMAVLHRRMNNLSQAEKEYQKVMSILCELSKKSINVIGPSLVVLNNLAELHHTMNRLVESESEYQEVLKIRRELVKVNSNVFKLDLATTLNNMACLYKTMNNLSESEVMYLEAQDILRELSQENPISYKPNLACTLHNLADLHYITNRFHNSKKEYKEALRLELELRQENPSVYSLDVATTLTGLARIHQRENCLVKSEREYQEALEILCELSQENQDVYSSNFAATLEDWAGLLQTMNRLSDAEIEYQKALEIFRGLAKANPSVYNSEVARTLNNLATLHSYVNCFSEAKEELEEAIKILRRLARENPSAYEPNLAQTLFNASVLYAKTRKYAEEAKRRVAEAIRIFEKYQESTPCCKELLNEARKKQKEILRNCSSRSAASERASKKKGRH